MHTEFSIGYVSYFLPLEQKTKAFTHELYQQSMPLRLSKTNHNWFKQYIKESILEWLKEVSIKTNDKFILPRLKRDTSKLKR